MKRHAKPKSAKARVAHRTRPRPARAKATVTKAHRPARSRRPAPAPRSHYTAAIQGLQDAAASLSDDEIIAILSDLSWPNRAKWLSSYFTDQLPEEVVSDEDDVAGAIVDIGAQVAALLTAMDVERPSDFVSAVTYCLSADPAHVNAGQTWLQDNLGSQTIDLDALEGLPGYQAVAEIVERVRDEAGD